MADSVAGVVLAAGAGERLRPLTRLRPKALCPVGNVALVDLALARFAGISASLAVNLHHGRDLLESHLSGRVHLSIEPARALGTAGALGALRDWIDGRPTLVVNADAWCPGSVAPLLDGWDGSRVRVLVPHSAGPRPPGLAPATPVAGALMPWPLVERLRPEPTGLHELVWRPEAEAGRMEMIGHDGPFVDCGTPARYLAANLAASGGRSVVGAGAQVAGELVRSVVWPGGVVEPGERLVDAIRAGPLTVLVR